MNFQCGLRRIYPADGILHHRCSDVEIWRGSTGRSRTHKYMRTSMKVWSSSIPVAQDPELQKDPLILAVTSISAFVRWALLVLLSYSAGIPQLHASKRCLTLVPSLRICLLQVRMINSADIRPWRTAASHRVFSCRSLLVLRRFMNSPGAWKIPRERGKELKEAFPFRVTVYVCAARFEQGTE